MTDAQTLVRQFIDTPGATELDAAITVAHLIEPTADATGIRSELQALGALCSATLGNTADAEGLCAFMAEQGYRGASEDYYDLDNSRLDRVIARRRGIPITLAIVYLAAARAAGLQAHGINFPGHFLLRVEHMFVDPFRHRTQTEADCLKRVEQLGDRNAAMQLLTRATPEDFLVRMLNNVRSIINDSGDLTRALELVQCQRLLRPRELGLGVEEARLWERLNVPHQACDTLTDLLPHIAHAPTREQMQVWINQLADRNAPTVH